tara:strand:+ start:713 stop:928 length:216 start_codon:yes stop_codon:yes gene_type:complete
MSARAVNRSWLGAFLLQDPKTQELRQEAERCRRRAEEAAEHFESAVKDSVELNGNGDGASCPPEGDPSTAD